MQRDGQPEQSQADGHDDDPRHGWPYPQPVLVPPGWRQPHSRCVVLAQLSLEGLQDGYLWDKTKGAGEQEHVPMQMLQCTRNTI